MEGREKMQQWISQYSAEEDPRVYEVWGFEVSGTPDARELTPKGIICWCLERGQASSIALMLNSGLDISVRIGAAKELLLFEAVSDQEEPEDMAEAMLARIAALERLQGGSHDRS